MLMPAATIEKEAKATQLGHSAPASLYSASRAKPSNGSMPTTASVWPATNSVFLGVWATRRSVGSWSRVAPVLMALCAPIMASPAPSAISVRVGRWSVNAIPKALPAGWLAIASFRPRARSLALSPSAVGFRCVGSGPGIPDLRIF